MSATLTTSGLFEAGRAHADAGLSPTNNDPEYMAGYDSSPNVISTHAPVSKNGPCTVSFLPGDVRMIFSGLVALIGVVEGTEAQSRIMRAWHTLADAVFDQCYGTTAETLAADVDNENVPTADELREQLGLQMAGLPTWLFQMVGSGVPVVVEYGDGQEVTL